jgi:NAD(P)H-hydrate repair Nnr-like enzyme with NAD(P)H-hydrate epimerase domain
LIVDIIPGPKLIIDALLGFEKLNQSDNNIQISNLINWTKSHNSISVLSIEFPAGASETQAPCINAKYTVAMGLLCTPHYNCNVGTLFLCDIGIPVPFLKRMPAMEGNLFW